MSRGARALSVLALLASACGGPRVPLEIGIKDYPTDIILGAQSVPEAPTPVQVIERGIPVPVQPPPRILRTFPERTPAPTAEPCPKADPFGTPPQELLGVQYRPPAAAKYSFRTSGSTKVGGAVLALPATTQRTVRPGTLQPSGEFRFEVETDRTTTTYRVVPRADAVQDAGIFLVRQTTKQPQGSDIVFAPTPHIKLLPFPVENGREWDAVGTDPSTQTTWVLRGKVGTLVADPNDPDGEKLPSDKRRVDACGVWIDAYAVEISGPDGAGRIVSPNMDLKLNAKYSFATQYGSISIYDETKLSGTVAGSAFESSNISSILTEPKLPQAP